MINSLAERFCGLVLVLVLHMAALYSLWSARLLPSPADAATLFVNFIAPPDEKKTPEPQRLPEHQPKPKLRPIAPPQPRQLVAETPVTAPTDFVAPAPLPRPEPIQVPLAVAAAPAPMPTAPLPVGPVALSAELSVACPQRSAPSYPAMSRRRGEQGMVLLRVELSETGAVAKAWVQNTSGFERLDESALAAVRTWHCTAPTRNGQPVRAIALQPFNFVIQGN